MIGIAIISPTPRTRRACRGTGRRRTSPAGSPNSAWSKIWLISSGFTTPSPDVIDDQQADDRRPCPGTGGRCRRRASDRLRGSAGFGLLVGRRRHRSRHVDALMDSKIRPAAAIKPSVLGGSRARARPKTSSSIVRRELAGERVLLARVEAAEEHVRPDLRLGAVPEPRARPRDRAPAPPSARRTPSQANAPSATIDAEPVEQPRAPGRGTAGSGRAPPASACSRAARTVDRGDVGAASARGRRRAPPTSAGSRTRSDAATRTGSRRCGRR